MWFLRRGHPLPAYPPEALLVVDLTETGQPLARIHRLIDEVNRCTRGETIRVRQRRSSDNGHDLIARQMNPNDWPQLASDRLLRKPQQCC